MAVTKRRGLQVLTAANDEIGQAVRLVALRLSAGVTGGTITITDGTAVIASETLAVNGVLWIQFGSGVPLANLRVTVLPATCEVRAFLAD